MEHGGRLPANCALTVYYLPVYPPYSDYNYGLRRLLVQISRECTLPYLSTGLSNLLQPAQAEVVLGQRSTYLASWYVTTGVGGLFYFDCETGFFA
jgi:hypothetical protein